MARQHHRPTRPPCSGRVTPVRSTLTGLPVCEATKLARHQASPSETFVTLTAVETTPAPSVPTAILCAGAGTGQVRHRHRPVRPLWPSAAGSYLRPPCRRTPVCWGWNGPGQAEPPPGEKSPLAADGLTPARSAPMGLRHIQTASTRVLDRKLGVSTPATSPGRTPGRDIVTTCAALAAAGPHLSPAPAGTRVSPYLPSN